MGFELAYSYGHIFSLRKKERKNFTKIVISFIPNWESLAQFENRIKPRMYVRRITRSIMYSTMYVKKKLHLAGTGVRKISSVDFGFSPIIFF